MKYEKMLDLSMHIRYTIQAVITDVPLGISVEQGLNEPRTSREGGGITRNEHFGSGYNGLQEGEHS